jgi:phosphoenolpyruvate---glycerone phosphotransferase subunit DhaM
MTDDAAVGIVLISHSRALAEGAADVANQVSGGAGHIIGVGGTDDGRLGTSIDALAAAIEKVSTGAGVVVIPDLGSSVLTTRAYLAADDAATADVVIADGPFVEGAVAAAVIASTGADLASVVTAAEEARDVRKL